MEERLREGKQKHLKGKVFARNATIGCDSDPKNNSFPKHADTTLAREENNISAVVHPHILVYNIGRHL